MKQFILPLGILGIAIFISTLLVLNREKPQIIATHIPPRAVEAQQVTLGDLRVTVVTQGTVEAALRTSLAAQVSGQIIWVSPLLAVGALVSKGEQLLAIDPTNYETALAQTQAEVAAARSHLAQETGLAEVAYSDWLKRGQQVNLDDAATNLALRRPQLAEAKARLAAAEASLKLRRTDLQRTKIVAPYDSIIEERLANLGQYVSPGAPLVTVFSVNHAEVRLPLSEHDLQFLDLPTPDMDDKRQYPMVIEAIWGNQRFQRKAHIVRTEGIIDRKNRVFYAIGKIDDPYQLSLNKKERNKVVPIGSFISGRILSHVIPHAVQVPQHALLPGSRVWVIDNGILKSQSVKVLALYNGMALINEGLRNGMLINLTMSPGLVSGSRVTVTTSKNTTVDDATPQNSKRTTEGDTIN